MPGKSYIKIASVLLIISSILCFIVYTIAGILLGYATVKTELNLGWLFVVICLLYTVAAVLQMIAGVKGVKGCYLKEAAPSLKKWGKVVLAISIIAALSNLIDSVLQGDSIAVSVLSILISFVVPALYIYGTSLNEKA